ncbi:MAG: altronate dehydratase family protein [Burkholderiales bacterium]|nr:altronate dehydratase family protein [Burkholderiales bacterium]
MSAVADRASIRLNAADNVVVARDDLAAGTPVEGLTTTGAIPRGHKVSTAAIGKGGVVRKYNQIIGFATAEIRPGEHVHTHNTEFGDFDRDYAFGADARPTDFVAAKDRATFQGYVRADGRIGTRNFVGVLASVNCSNSVARLIADAFAGDRLAAWPHVDGVVALPHQTGCCIPLDGDTHGNLERTLVGHARHPNFAGVLLVGLGCEVAQINTMLERYGLAKSKTMRTLVIQDEGGTAATVAAGITHVREMLAIAELARRSTVDASHLTVALECGGSDGYSGITANPALGAAVDLLVRHGGTGILAETPEIYGAEHLLTRRAVTQAVGEKLIARIKWWEQHTAANQARMDNNPTPGNKKGGLTTILEKSLGAVAKGGTTMLMDVYKYAEPVTAKGFVFMDSPGYDPASITGMVAGGANVTCFTTGRGSVYGGKPVPSLKLATNTPMFERMSDDMDINCGVIADGSVSTAEMGERIFQLILDTASGRPSKSETHGIGDLEFCPWQTGAVM